MSDNEDSEMEIEDMEEPGKISLKEFTARILRLPRKGAFEMMLAQHLAASIPAEPMRKARLICEAAYMAPKDKLNLNFEEIDIIYCVCLSFLNCFVEKNSFSAFIGWNFELTEENYKKYIDPWHSSNQPLYLGAQTELDARVKMEKLKQFNGVERFWFLTCKLGLHLGSLKVLEGEFLTWCMPKVMQVFEKLSRLVDPELYKDLLASLNKKGNV